MSSPQPPLRRIVIALETSRPADYLLEVAQYVPAGETAELVGLFIEDARLLQYAQSRLAREIVLSGGVRPLERGALERQLRAQSAQVRRHFEAAAAKLGLRHEFQVARGEIVSEWIRSATEAEALIVSLAVGEGFPAESRRDVVAQLARAGLHAVLFARPGWSTGRNVLAIIETPGQLHAVLGAAIHIAARSRSPLGVILSGDALDEREHVEADIAATVREHGIELPASAVLTRADARHIVQTAEVANARLLVLAGGATAPADLLGALLNATQAALLLVRAD